MNFGTLVAGYNAVHLLVSVKHEVPDGVNALSLVLENIPRGCRAPDDLQFYGRTPLMIGSIVGCHPSKLLTLVYFS